MTWSGSDELERKLTAMKGNALQSLLLAVFRARTNAQRPRDVRRAFERRFCRPSDADVRSMHKVDGHLFEAAEDFELLELSPLAPLGVCTAVGPCDPLKIVATVRNLEVSSDPTNVLALEASERRRQGAKAVHLAASQRVVRAQPLVNPHHRAHFRLFVLCSMFQSEGSGRAESAALLRHLGVYSAALAACGATLQRVSVCAVGQPWETVRQELGQKLEVPVDDQDDRITNNNYYMGLSFKVHVRLPNTGNGGASDLAEEIPLGDGGFTSWGAQYLSRSKERTLISAIGTELLAKCL